MHAAKNISERLTNGPTDRQNKSKSRMSATKDGPTSIVFSVEFFVHNLQLSEKCFEIVPQSIQTVNDRNKCSFNGPRVGVHQVQGTILNNPSLLAFMKEIIASSSIVIRFQYEGLRVGEIVKRWSAETSQVKQHTTISQLDRFFEKQGRYS